MSRARTVAAALFVCGLGLAQPAPSTAQGTRISLVEVGFGGTFKVGHWTEVTVHVETDGPEAPGTVDVTVSDGDGVLTRVSTPGDKPLVVAAGRPAAARLLVRFGRLEDTLEASWRPNSGQTVTRKLKVQPARDSAWRSLPSSDRLIVGVGPPCGLEELATGIREGSDRLRVATIPDAEKLPLNWLGYEAVETLVVNAADANVVAALTAHGPRRAALVDWVAGGGRLVLFVADSAAEVLAEGTVWSQLTRAHVNSVEPLRRSIALETFAGMSWPQYTGVNVMQAPRLSFDDGQILLSENEVPLASRRPEAFGSVTLVGLEPSQPPLSDWPGRTRLLERVVLGEKDRKRTGSELAESSTASQLGLTDLSGQLRAGLDKFKGVNVLPFWVVGAVLLSYIILIGPVDYYLLKKLVGRMELAWLTLPLVALAVCVFSYWLANRAKGHALLWNHVELFDVDVASGRTRGTNWFTIYSPQTKTYDVDLSPAPPEAMGAPGRSKTANSASSSSESSEQTASRTGTPAAVSWLGLPGAALGGMEPANVAPRLADVAYQAYPQAGGLTDVPIHVWSTKTFVGKWQVHAAGLLEANLTAGLDRVAEGTITSRLPFALERCLLAYGTSMWSVEEISPGEVVRVRAGEQHGLVDVLKDVKLVQEKRDVLSFVSTRYDPASLDLPTILRQMMYYEATGGRAYCGLSNGYQQSVDLTRHLEMDRAILIGIAPDEAAVGKIQLDNEPLLPSEASEQLVVYRFVIPVSMRQPASGRQ